MHDRFFRTRDGRHGPRGAGRPGRTPIPAHTSKPRDAAGRVSLAITVDPDVKQALIEIADAKRVPIVEVHREALLDYIGRQRMRVAA